MSRPLNVLIVEDSEADALLLIRQLRRGGYEPHAVRVDSATRMAKALTERPWDVVICDYSLPEFDGPAALALFKSAGMDIPFIVVSGVIGEEAAVKMMKAGAHDYLLKDHLARLLPAIERELREAEERRCHRRAEEERAHLAALVESSEDGIVSTTPEGIILTWNHGAEKIFGYAGIEAKSRPIQFMFAASERELLTETLRKIACGESVSRFPVSCMRKDLRTIDVSLTLSAIKDCRGQITAASAIVRDITERKRAEAQRDKLLQQLRQAVSQVKALSGLLPICASCKKIRDDEGYWHQVEVYIEKHSGAAFTHGFCPDCLKKLYPQFIPNYSPEAHKTKVAEPKSEPKPSQVGSVAKTEHSEQR